MCSGSFQDNKRVKEYASDFFVTLAIFMIVTNRKADITMVIYMGITSFRYVSGVGFIEEGFSFLFYKSQNWYIVRRNDEGSHAKRYFFSNLSKNHRALKERRCLGSRGAGQW